MNVAILLRYVRQYINAPLRSAIINEIIVYSIDPFVKVIDSFVYPIETLRYNVQLRFYVFESNANGKIRFNRTKKPVKFHATPPEKNGG